MNDALLDNPFWSALTTTQRAVAQGDTDVRRYPGDIAPFFGVKDAARPADAALARLIAPGETLDALGVRPRLSDAWHIETFQPLAQMVRDAPLPVVPGPPIVALDAGNAVDVADVRDLTALVYPHYFRARTMRLGRYFGIRAGGQLVAMLGERVQIPGATEISAVCTHPDWLGHGYARRLVAHLVNDLLARGVRPFLHVAYDNTCAKSLYDRLAFRTRAELGFWAVTRSSSH